VGKTGVEFSGAGLIGFGIGFEMGTCTATVFGFGFGLSLESSCRFRRDATALPIHIQVYLR